MWGIFAAIMMGIVVLGLFVFRIERASVFHIIIQIVIGICSYIVGAVYISRYYGGRDYIFRSTVHQTAYALLSLTLYILFGALFILIKRMIRTKKIRFSYVLFFLLPIGQLFLIKSFLSEKSIVYWLIGLLLSTAANVLLLFIIIEQERKDSFEEAFREAGYRRELEAAHYKEVEHRRSGLKKIKEDIEQQLEQLVYLVESHQKEAGQELLQNISKSIEETSGNVYCNIPVANAILTEKAKECLALNINLEIDFNISKGINIEPMHLCSILGNLMDNAIAASKETKEPRIKLISQIEGSYLFIKTINSSKEPSKKKRKGHGYGCLILSEVASNYGGEYLCEYKRGTFVALVSLEIE